VTDGGFPYFLQAETHPEIYIGQRFGHAHNVLLDLALWVGMPLALFYMVAALIWAWRACVRGTSDLDALICVLLLVTFSVHAMLEVPHQYFYLLLPVGLVIGMLCRLLGERTIVWSPRGASLVAAGLIWGVAAIVAFDYFRYQERYTEWRFDTKRIGYQLERTLDKPLVLTQLHDELALYRLELPVPPSSELLAWMEETAQSTATGPAIYYTIRALGVAGRHDDARRWMKRYNAISTPAIVDTIKNIWALDQNKYPQLIGLEWPSYAGRTSTFRFEEESSIAR
jgi:hypothetical protein